MKKRLMLATLLATVSFGGPAHADLLMDLKNAVATRDLTRADQLLSGQTQPVDKEVKALLESVLVQMRQDPDYAAALMTLAGKFADNLTPPGVPPVCDEVRQIVSSVPDDMKSSPFYSTIAAVTEQFAKSPVVVSAGNPNLCAVALDETDDAQFAQQPVFARVVILRPNNPGSPRDLPSAE